MNALQALFKTHDALAPLAARVALGIVMFPHGTQKVLGWFGGHGFSATMQGFTEHMHIPAVLAFLAIAAEFAGSLCLLAGFLARVAAFGIGVNMLVAIFKVHLANGFFMNWMGNQKGEGIEYHLLALGLAIVILAQGAGRWSIDYLISRRNTFGKPECNSTGKN